MATGLWFSTTGAVQAAGGWWTPAPRSGHSSEDQEEDREEDQEEDQQEDQQEDQEEGWTPPPHQKLKNSFQLSGMKL